jgi:hypothetical protein
MKNQKVVRGVDRAIVAQEIADKEIQIKDNKM